MKKLNSVLLSCLLAATSSVMAESLPQQPHISVSGVAQIQVKPDTVRIEFQSITVEKEADSAKKSVDQQVQQILSQLEKNGFEQSLLTRADIRLRPEFEYIEKKRTQVGIKAIRNLSYQLDDVSKVNVFLQMLVEADVSHVGQVHYALKDPLQWQLKARDLAVKDSISKALGLAESYQASLGKVYSIQYQANHVQPVLMRAMESDHVAPLYQNNQITINERVDTVFLLQP